MNKDLEALAAWNVETADLSGRIMAAIGADTTIGELVTELRSLRLELADLRLSNSNLQTEMNRLRAELSGRSPRIAPYAPTEGLIRLA